MNPHYIIRLDKVDDNLPEGRASVQLAFTPEEKHVAPEILDHLFEKLEAFIAVHEHGVGE